MTDLERRTKLLAIAAEELARQQRARKIYFGGLDESGHAIVDGLLDVGMLVEAIMMTKEEG